MLTFTDPASEKALNALGDGRTRELLLKFARWFMPSDADAEDLFTDALLKVCDPEEGRPWDPSRGTFLTHMRVVMRDLWQEGKRRAAARREVLDAHALLGALDPAPNPEDALSEARATERRHRLGEQLRERIAHHPLTLQVFDAACEGLGEAAAIAEHLGRPVQEVYDCNEKIVYHGRRLIVEDAAFEQARMTELRERATPKKELS